MELEDFLLSNILSCLSFYVLNMPSHKTFILESCSCRGTEPVADRIDHAACNSCVFHEEHSSSIAVEPMQKVKSRSFLQLSPSIDLVKKFLDCTEDIIRILLRYVLNGSVTCS